MDVATIGKRSFGGGVPKQELAFPSGSLGTREQADGVTEVPPT
jgi:hypothetical protein